MARLFFVSLLKTIQALKSQLIKLILLKRTHFMRRQSNNKGPNPAPKPNVTRSKTNHPYIYTFSATYPESGWDCSRLVE